MTSPSPPDPSPHDLLAALAATATTHPAAPAIGDLTYAQLGARVAATAAGLRAAGLTEGDRVLFSVRPDPAGVVLALGIVAAGGTVVFADPSTGPELFGARLALAQPRWAAAESLLYTAALAPALARRRGLLLPSYRDLRLRHLYAGPWLPGVPRGALSAARLARPLLGSRLARPLLGSRSAAPFRPRGHSSSAAVTHVTMPEQGDLRDREALVVFTSGTTAAPRAVVHTRGSLGAALAVFAEATRLGPGDVVHTDQLMVGLPALVAGAHWTMPPFGLRPHADPARYAAGLAGATHTFAVPADLAAVLDARLALPPTLRVVLTGGAPVTPALLTRLTTALPRAEFLAIYGMTEILPVAVVSAAEKLAHDGSGDLVGRPLPGVMARVAEDGELHLAGPHLARGYLGEPPLTEHATGDLARLDDQGRVVLIGRKKDMIIRGRTNIYPGLYEPAIARLPGVATATLLGLPDPATGDERVVLVLTPTPGTDPASLPATVRAALPGLIDASALPDEVRVLPELPVTGRTAKPARDLLRELIQ